MVPDKWHSVLIKEEDAAWKRQEQVRKRGGRRGDETEETKVRSLQESWLDLLVEGSQKRVSVSRVFVPEMLLDCGETEGDGCSGKL